MKTKREREIREISKKSRKILRLLANFAYFAIFAFSLLFASSETQGQTQGERGLKIRVGAAPGEIDKGPAPDLWAVIIGVSRYQYGDQDIDGSRIPNLKYATEDALGLNNFLRSEEGGGFRDVSDNGHLILLRDDQATKAEVERALNTMKQSKPNDYFVLYIAAHGVLVPQYDPNTKVSEDVPYFFLYDTDPRSQQSIDQTGLRMERLQQLIREIPAKKGLVLTDTCHSAGVDMAGRGVKLAASRANLRHIEEMQRIPEGIGFIAAAQQTESSLERDELGHGVFTSCLLEGLRGHADTNRDGRVIFEELAKYLNIEVPRMTNNQQHPHINTTRISTNQITLSEVRYTTSACDKQPCGTLVVRAPELEEVMVVVDDSAPLPLGARAERTWKVPAGDHRITFTHGGQREEMRAKVEAGRSLIFEVNLSFTESNSNDLVEPAPAQVNVYFREEQEPSPEAKDLLIKGIVSFDRQQFEDSIETLNRAIAANNGAYADALVYRGRAEQSLGRKKEAVASFQQALKLRPTDYETRTLLAEARFNAGDNLRAVEQELRKIITLHPNDDFARLVLADMILARGGVNLIEAEMQLRRAIRNRPLSPPAHLILADVLMDLGGRETEAVRSRGAVMTQPNAKLAEAITEAEKALSLFTELSRKRAANVSGPKPPSMANVFLSGARYTNTAALAEANHAVARALMRAIENDDTQAGNHDYLRRARAAIEEAAKHARQLRDTLRLTLVMETSAHLSLMQEDVQSAIKSAEEALRLAAQTPGLNNFFDPHFTLYSAYATQQDFARAAEHLQIYLNGYRFKMKPEQSQALDAELKRLRRDAQLHGQSKSKGDKMKKKNDP